jgi:protein phosphatase-4 regulatory subunit 3
VPPQQEEAKILVTSEDDPTRQLLESRITKDDGYQKQQGMDVLIWAWAIGR